MKTLIIYDMVGKIYYYVETDENTIETLKPEGLPYLTIDIPSGKRVVSVDTSANPHVPIFEDIPKSEVQLLQEQVNNLNLALAEMMGV